MSQKTDVRSAPAELEPRTIPRGIRVATRRLADTLVVLGITSIIVFALVRLIPGDPASVMAGPDASEQQIEAIRERNGLDEPLLVQNGVWMGNLLTGDFGDSLTQKRPVTEVIARRLPATLELAFAGFLVIVIFGLTAGTIAGLYRGGKFDWFISTFNIASVSIPTFWSGLLFLLVFGLWLGWFPIGGRVPLIEDPIGSLHRLLLPALVLGLTLGPELAWFVRNGILETRGEDYIRTAYAKGISRRRLVSQHLLRNGFLPVVTVLGVQLGRLLSSAVVVEAVFTWPGLGSLSVQSILARDYPVVQAVILLFVVLQVSANLLADVTYAAIDPRVEAA